MLNNRPNYDATFCGKLPLHQTNMIQPHGAIVLIAGEDWEIIQVSENITSIIKESFSQLIGQSLKQFLLPESILNLQQKLPFLQGKLPVTLSFNEKGNEQQLLALVHKKQEYYLLEMELEDLVEKSKSSFSDVYQQLKYVMSALDAAATVQEICTIVAEKVKQLSGFDKVMIYTFDEAWNGTVVAEAMEPDMDSYLGLTFPASDIPKPARDMYLKNPYRIIPNKNYTPVKLYPVLNPVTNAFTDLSDCDLRSVAAVHVEYLTNMGVVASMSTRIVHEEKLWGLISCHHLSPKYLSYEMCSVFELLSNMLSTKLSTLQFQQLVAVKTSFTQLYTQVIEHIYLHENLLSAFISSEDLFKELLRAEGVALSWNGRIELLGNTPRIQEVEHLIYWLQSGYSTKLYHQPSLPGVLDEAMVYSPVASGLLALPVQPELGNFLLAFRPEVLKNVSWGGDPNEVITFEKDSSVYHPRHSFSIWRETVRHTATPWTAAELEAAENLRNFLIEYTLNRLLK